jgi:hypothetical protein
VKVTGIGRNSVQGDIRFADVLEKMGAPSPGAMTSSPVPTAS